MSGMIRSSIGTRWYPSNWRGSGSDMSTSAPKLRSLDLPTRQKIEIARAISHQPRILLLDEPTASLSARDVDWLGTIIERLTREGATIIFISHRMQEVRRFCSALTILRNGRSVGSHRVDAISDDDVIELMIGRSLAAAFPPKPSEPRPASAGSSSAGGSRPAVGGVNGISLDLWPRWITGLGGLDGMGQRELFLALFGLAEIELRVHLRDGQQVTLRSPADAISERIGISMVPEDRKGEGLFLDLDGRQNISLPSLDRFVRWGLVDGRAEGRSGSFGTRARSGRAACAMELGSGVQRRQPAEDRSCQMAACRKPDPAAVRSDAGSRRWYESGDISSGQGFCRGRGCRSLLFDRHSRTRQSLRRGCGYLPGADRRNS